MKKGLIAILGCGETAQTWALLHTAYGYDVVLYDEDSDLLLNTAALLRERIFELRKEWSRGNVDLEDRLDLIHVSADLTQVISSASIVQECLQDDLHVKRKVYEKMDAFMSKEQIILSNTSHILPSTLFAELQHESQFAVCHAVQPATLCPVVELVPGPNTCPATMRKARQFMIDNEQTPICLTREIEGFAINRLQYALICEGLRMVQQGLFKLSDFETIVKEGLGLRWALAGPLETVHLSGEGVIGPGAPFKNVLATVSKTISNEPISCNATLHISNEKVRKQYRDLGLARLRDLKEGLDQLDIASQDVTYPKHTYPWMTAANRDPHPRSKG